jgi:hypothetical protein
VVVANPPYMDSRNLTDHFAGKIKRKMSAFASGLDVAFVGRSLDWVVQGGYFSLVTMDSWLANEECVEARTVMRWAAPVVALLHLGSRAFPEISGEVVRVAATCFRKSAATETLGIYIDAASGRNGAEKRLQFADPTRRHSHLPQWFDVFPKRPLSAFPATEAVRRAFAGGTTLDSLAEVKTGLQTGDNGRFLRNWHELGLRNIRTHSEGGERWVPYVKNRNARRWYASEEFVIDWGDNGSEIRDNPSARFQNSDKYFLPGISFNGIGKQLKASVISAGRVFDQQNSMLFYEDVVDSHFVVALLNSGTFAELVSLISPKRFNIGAMRKVPLVTAHLPEDHAERIARAIWIQSIRETQTESSIDFHAPLLASKRLQATLLESEFERTRRESADLRLELAEIEQRNTQFFNNLYSLKTTIAVEDADAAADESEGDDGPLGAISNLVSFAVGCMFGRYSLDAPGLVLADQGDSLAEYLAKVPSPSFMPDEDNVLPVLSDGWFEDDIVERFREFLKVSFGVEHFEENLRFVEDALGKDVRKYFVQDFYKDHVQRYKKRPIYWMFSSPKGSFNALIYMHRYRPDTVSVVLNDYLHEFQAKLRARRANLDQVAVSTLSTAKEQTAARKEAEQIGKMLLELEEWEQSVLYPLATEQVAIDLDDGVKANYPKFGTALNNKFTGF